MKRAIALLSAFLLSAGCGQDGPAGARNVPPEVVSASVSADTLVLEGLDRELTVAVRARDDFAVSTVEATIGPSGGAPWYDCALTRVAVGEAMEGDWRCTITVEADAPKGLWAIRTVQVRDAAGIEAVATEDELGVRFAVVEANATEIHPRYIERLPRLDFDPFAADPTRDGWPAPGQTVTWVGHVKSWSARPLEFDYAWELDGAVVAQGRAAVAPNGTVAVEYAWPWTFERHELGLVVDTGEELVEESEANNRLAVVTSALSVAAWVEESVYYSYRRLEPQWRGAGSVSFEDFVNRQVRLLNERLAQADFPETPGGVDEAFRVDRIEIVGDFLVKERQRPAPAFGDRSADLHYGWGAPDGDFETNFNPITPPPDLSIGSYSRAFAHAALASRGAIGLSRFVIGNGHWGHSLRITEGSVLAVVTDVMPGIEPPGISRRVYERNFDSVMDPPSGWARPPIARPTAAIVQSLAGQRSRSGFVPADTGAALRALPGHNRVRLVDPAGSAIAGADVRVFRGMVDPNNRIFLWPVLWPDAPYAIVTTDAAGVADLGPQPFTDAASGPLLPDQMTIILRVSKDGRVSYGYLDTIDFALARLRGEVEWTQPLTLDLKVP